MRFQSVLADLGEEVSLKRFFFESKLGDVFELSNRSADDLEHNILISGLDHAKHGAYTIIKDDQALKVQYQVAALMPSNEKHAKTAPIGQLNLLSSYNENEGLLIMLCMIHR